MLYPVLRAHQIPWQPACISSHFPTLTLNRSLLLGELNKSIFRCPSEGSSAANPVICTHFCYLVLKLQNTFTLELSIWINTTVWWENTASSPGYGKAQPHRDEDTAIAAGTHRGTGWQISCSVWRTLHESSHCSALQESWNKTRRWGREHARSFACGASPDLKQVVFWLSPGRRALMGPSLEGRPGDMQHTPG